MPYAMQEARTKGLAEGRAKGLAEGLEEGRAAGHAEGRAEGRAEGELNSRKAIARKMIEMGMPLEKIAEATGLDTDTIEAL